MRLPGLPASPVEESRAARFFAWASFAAAAGAIGFYAEDVVVPVLAVAVAAAGHVFSYRRRHTRRSWLRQGLIAALVAACLVYFILDSVTALFGGQVPQAHFALLLVAVTSFDLRTRRNLYSSIWIGLAILYLAAVYAWDYPFVGFAVAWAACLAGFWASSHLGRLGARPRVAAGPVAAGLVASLVAGGGAFLLLPQPTAHPTAPLVVSLPSGLTFKGELESPALRLIQLGNDPSGSNGTLDLRYRGRLGNDVVMLIRSGAPAYWRGLVFDHYSNGIWTASSSGFHSYPPYVDQRELPAPLGPQLGTFVQVVRVMRPLPGIIYAAAPIQAIYYPAAEIRQDAYGAWRAPGPMQADQTYSVVSSLPDFRPNVLRVASGPDDIDPAYRDFSGLSARGQALARQVVADADSDRYDRVMAVTTYLQDHYRYSLELGHAPSGADPVDWFLFGSRTGYCEQFATAEALLLRSVGIPARLATGYSTGQYDPVLNQSIVRERDAHAWVEVYFPGHGWVPVDASPGFPALATGSFPNRFAASGLARLVPHLTVGAPAAAMTGLGLAGLLPAIAGVLVALAVVTTWLWRRRRPLRGRRRGPPEQLELLRLYERLQARAGRRRAAAETPREYAATAPPPLAAIANEVTRAVERGAYGGAWPAPDEVERLRAKLGRA